MSSQSTSTKEVYHGLLCGTVAPLRTYLEALCTGKQRVMLPLPADDTGCTVVHYAARAGSLEALELIESFGLMQVCSQLALPILGAHLFNTNGLTPTWVISYGPQKIQHLLRIRRNLTELCTNSGLISIPAALPSFAAT